MQKNKKFINTLEFEQEALNSLNQNAYQHYRSGANAEHTLRSNTEDFQKILLNPYVCAGLNDIDLQTTVLGQKVNIPIGIAPAAFQKMAHDLGEVNLVRAANKKGTIYTQSMFSNATMKEVSQELNSLRFFQLYITKDRKISQKLVQNAEQLGYKAIVLTVDRPWQGLKESDDSFSLPKHLKFGILDEFPQEQQNIQIIDSAFKWEDVKWLQSVTSLPIILKGITNGHDALKAAQLGAHIWISNHGGRQLDTMRSGISILHEIIESIKGYNIEVYVDGGIRRGTDVVKCLALGANYVFVGRPCIYANASEGEQGVLKMFDIFEKEIKYAMMFLGAGKIKDLGIKHIIKNTIPRSNL